MSLTACLMRRDDGLFEPATDYDREQLNALTVFKPYKVEVKRMSDRSYQHHKLFFGGLLPLAYQYWQPTGGLVGASERETVQWVIKELCRRSGMKTDLLLSHANTALDTLARKRSERFGAAQQSMEAFRQWLTIEAGFCDIVETPRDVRKAAKSISFASMDQESFNQFYQACFAVAWNMMLYKAFENEEEAEHAARQLMEMGA